MYRFLNFLLSIVFGTGTRLYLREDCSSLLVFWSGWLQPIGIVGYFFLNCFSGFARLLALLVHFLWTFELFVFLLFS